MKKLPIEKISVYAVSILLVVLLTPFVHKIPRTHRNPLYHLLYAIVCLVVLLLVPRWITTEIFSHGGVLVACTVVPAYESIVAACSITAEDDRSWLQYWIVSAYVSMYHSYAHTFVTIVYDRNAAFLSVQVATFISKEAPSVGNSSMFRVFGPCTVPLRRHLLLLLTFNIHTGPSI